MNTTKAVRAAQRSGHTMSAVVQTRYGAAPEHVLGMGRAERPAPLAGEVLVRVRAASVDRGTWHLMAGLPYPARLVFGLRRPSSLNPGRPLAGVVEAVGEGVTDVRPGDEVYGIASANGTFAEYAVAEQGKLDRKPANLSFEEAAAVPVSAGTALEAVRDHARVQPGEQVLVIGASGGVGTFAVQIAKALGAEVTGMASGAKLDAVRALGADAVLDHRRDEIPQRRFDAIIDIAGRRSLAHLRRALTPHGRLVIVGGETGGRLLDGLGRQFRAALLSPFVGQTLGFFVSKERGADLRALTALLEAGSVTPLVDGVFPLAETAAAVEYLVDGRATGKVVVTV
ncbi:NADPH:quinone reductase [Geodermatophilus saharensis]|uniref:NADPH:quinone reductase n=1 Tax=Geodermatophilus saharensis TaxID=1137994 RepID=A0A239C2W0_9ACTN|nr:NAD(P)-dependent alcohol dehydrogenase [Geodermatophilus saharensis]SNS14460.1 NADPH:quinone reductase [Geodermatophilus saharensis]